MFCEMAASSRQDSMCTARGSAGAAMQPVQRAELPEQGDAPRLRPDRKVEHSNSQTGGRRAHRRDHRARWLRHASSSRSRMLLPCPTNASGSWRRKLTKEEQAMREAQPSVQKMDRARARFKTAVIAGDQAMDTMHKAQAAFEHAQQEVLQLQAELEQLTKESPLPVVRVPQLNTHLVKS